MQTFINISATLILLVWPMLFMMSPMMFDAPGSENDKNHIISLILILCYPVGLFVLLWLSGFNYFGISSLKLAAISMLVIVLAFSFFGYHSLLFNALRGIANSGYSIVENAVYYDGKQIAAADRDSFTIFDDGNHRQYPVDYAVDRHHLYYEGKVIEGALTREIRKTTINGDTYLLNASQVVYRGKILPHANPDNFFGFEGFRGWTFSIDDGQYTVFSYGNPLPDVDRDTFKPLNDFLARDRERIFEKDQPILPEADAVSFQLFEDHSFGRDNKYVYYLATTQPFIIDNADPASFEVLERGYLKDKNHIYFIHQYQSVETLEQVDTASFEVTGYDEPTQSEARDKHHFYYDGKIVGDR